MAKDSVKRFSFDELVEEADRSRDRAGWIDSSDGEVPALHDALMSISCELAAIRMLLEEKRGMIPLKPR